MLEFNFTEKDRQKYCKKAQERLDEAGIKFLRPDPNAIGARGWDCITKKADVVIVHMLPYPKNKWTRKKEAECKKVKGWCIQKDAKQGSGWRGHNMAPEMPDPMMHSRIEFEDGRGRHGAKG